ncbi:sigma-54 interaction domain-containing protein [Bremerella sp.]|uniref:sigma-54 interaction domain-containing protein n=1 Tax=Bremerella sp. TaxID=2795602 RepID=UPI00391AE69E
MARRILLTWIGHTDLKAMGAALPPAKRKKVEEIVRGEIDADVGPGPVKTLVERENFTEVHALSNYDPSVTKQFVSWLKKRCVTHHVVLTNPSDHGQVLDAVRPVLASVDVCKEDELCFHLSPGTPAMAAIWILLGKSQYPATLFQTHYEKVWKTEIPFDITTDVIPQLLREPDRIWQHLAIKSPQEIHGFEGIIGESPAIKMAVGRAQRAAVHDVPVLILGESGTGKEMVAEAIHYASCRRNKKPVLINCAAISSNLLESELFGHVKGSFTGAEKDRKGAFELADGSTLFLDEVGECNLEMQAKLLRALQPPPKEGPCCRVFRPVGSEKDIKVDVRIVAATNKNLTEAVERGEFREDLLYRLSIVTVKLPALREREGDVILLAESLLLDINSRLRRGGEAGYEDKSLSVDAKRFVQQYHWPGNVRELSNALLQAAVMAQGRILSSQDIAAAIADLPSKKKSEVLDCPLGGEFSIDIKLEEIQAHFIRRAMAEAGGKVTKAAKLLGMKHYQTLAAQLERLGIEHEPDEA